MGNAENINGVEIYTDQIHRYADDYIYSLDCKPEEVKSEMKRTPIFKGMLKHIYLNVFKPKKEQRGYNGFYQNTVLNYDDIESIDKIWDIYTSLCYKYNQNPTLLNFCMLTGLRNETISDWINGVTRAGGDVATSAHCQTAKRWKRECESAAFDVAMAGNPGGMFILKACHGYTEQPQRIEVVNGNNPAISAQDIAARLKSGNGSGQALPELPDLR